MKDLFFVINKYTYNIEKGFSYWDDKNEILIISNTELYNLNNEKYQLKDIIDIYLSNIYDINNSILGLFSLFIIDYKKKQCYCIQDFVGDSIPIYVYKNKDELVISNSLKEILIYSDAQFSINKDSIKNFLLKGYVEKSDTLIENINKLNSRSNLVIDFKGNYEFKILKKKRYKRNSCLRVYDSYDNYYNLFKKEIQKEVNKHKNIAITISNGYDSNLILNVIGDQKMDAFSIGGKLGVNEIPYVKKNLKSYNNVELHTGIVDFKILNKYPDIIFQLDGFVYERGVFLQYLLGNLIEENRKKDMVLFFGEGADQVLSINYNINLEYYLRCIKRIFLRPKGVLYNHGTFEIKKDFEFLSYVIMKKNGIIMNNKKINCVYPYLNLNFWNYTNNLVLLNGRNKKFHKKVCKKYIKLDLFQNLKKTCGATNTITLFKDLHEFSNIEKIALKSKYNILKIKIQENEEEYIDYILKIIYLEIFEYIFINYSNRKLLSNNCIDIELSQIIKMINIK